MARNLLTPFRSGGGLIGGGDPFLSLHREMNRLFDDAFRGSPAAAGQGSGAGSFVDALMNVSETDNEVRITAELPGVTEGDIDVSLDDDVLTIRGEKKFKRTEGGERKASTSWSAPTAPSSARTACPSRSTRIRSRRRSRTACSP
jgi:HSP20 family protein